LAEWTSINGSDAIDRVEQVGLTPLCLSGRISKVFFFFLRHSHSLNGLTSFGHLRNLERLDISYNDLDSLRRKFIFSFMKKVFFFFFLSRVILIIILKSLNAFGICKSCERMETTSTALKD
jgi:hypothetical protein